MSTIDQNGDMEFLRQWQRAKLSAYGEGIPSFKSGPSGVTVLTYFFRPRETADAYFPYTKCALYETWRLCGAMKTVIVSHEITPPVAEFASRFPDLVEVQVEPTLRSHPPGDVDSMSTDCNANLHKRFSTPEVLIVQDDGFPLRPYLERFTGRFDFIGSPFRRPYWYVQIWGRLLRDWPCNGGFSLRSKKMCELVSEYWHRHYEGKPFEVSQTEDLFYTETLPRRFREFRWSVHIAESKPASRFCFDGCIPYRPDPDVFGFHSARGFRAIVRDLRD